jgi:hypothetical protein
VPIITSTMLRYDPTTCTVWFTDPARAPEPDPGSLRRTLVGFALAGLATRAVEFVLAARR